MNYYQNENEKIVLSYEGKKVLDFLGLSLTDLKKISSYDLINICKKAGEPLKGFSKSGSGNKHSQKTGNVYNLGLKDNYEGFSSGGDSGSPNRFYSLDAWWEKRNITLTDESAFFDVPKPSKAEKNKGLDFKGNISDEAKINENLNSDNPNIKGRKVNLISNICLKSKGNFHNTVKPVKLFTYLCELFSKKGDTVLDPFMGSGTTGIACSILQREFIGIELEKDYFKIAEARIKEQNKQTSIFKGNN